MRGALIFWLVLVAAALAVGCPRAAAHSSPPPPDREAPKTTITQAPTGPVGRAGVSLHFVASERAHFWCRVDGGAWSGCSSPAGYSGLSEGDHTFEVFAMDTVGNREVTPAAAGFAVDTSPPETTITAAPRAKITGASAIFRFASSDPAARFECRLDTGVWAQCSSPQSFVRLGPGRRVFKVRAVDSAGNADRSPARAIFAVRPRAAS